LEGGAHIRQVQAVLGHASLATTEHYLRRLDAEELAAAMAGRWYGGDAA
jgi:site-specific recombinase XerD